MSDSSLVPERPLVFSPGLAATLGLEEAILLQHLHGLRELQPPTTARGIACWSASWAYLQHSLPFWDNADIVRIAGNLEEQGVLLLPAGTRDDAALLFAFDTQETPGQRPETRATAAPATPPPELPTRRRATPLAADWVPGGELLHLLQLNHNIPRQFALDQLEDFIYYWRERGEVSHAWENKFRQHVTSNWRRHQQQQAEAFREPARPLDKDWRPSADALEILARDGVDDNFIEQAVPEFVLYWRERGVAPRELNTRFLQHIRIQWARFSSSLVHSTEPSRIPAQWEPSEDVFDILRMSHIEADFARSLLPEFIIYWRDSNQMHTSWNSKFLQHVKYHWAKRHQMADTGKGYEGRQGTHRTGRTRDSSLEDDLTDTSWAE